MDEKYARWLRYVPARAYGNGVFVAICNQVGDNKAGRTFTGATFVCDSRGEVIARTEYGDRDEMVIVDLTAASLAESRQDPETFFGHFCRQEIYKSWGL
mgnify:CR=1 FL=1